MPSEQDTLTLALDHHRAGRLVEAGEVYDSILRDEPEQLDALFLAGQAARDRGDSAKALELFQRAFAIGGDRSAAIAAPLGRLCLETRHYREAAEVMARAITLAPQDAECRYMLGLAHRCLGDTPAALATYGQTVALDPNHAKAWCEAGLIHHTAGRYDEAVRCFRQMTIAAPEMPEGWSNLSAALAGARRYSEAVEPARRGIELRPDWPQSYTNLGVVLERAGRHDEAAAAYEQGQALAPNDPDMLCNRGNHLVKMGRREEGLAVIEQALAAAPREPRIHQALGEALRNLGRHHEALAAFKRCLILDPANASALNALGNAQPAAEGAVTLRRSVTANPQFVEAWSNLAGAYRQLGRLDDAIAAYRRALTVEPGHAAVHSNLLLTLCYNHSVSREELMAEHLAWAAIHEAPYLAATRARHWPNDRDPNRRLRIGYISGDFFDHAAAFFIEPLLAGHDHERVHVTCYANVPNPDNVTAHLRTLADDWVDAARLSDDALFERILADRIDVLIDGSGHTAHNRLEVVARKPAPIQAHWLGYAATTGLVSMDYILTDPYSIPPSEEKYFTETIWRLPKVWRSFKLIITPPPVAPLPLKVNGRPTFGSLNAFVKVTDATLAVWAKLLRRVPNADLVVMGVASQGETEAAFARHGIGPERLKFVGRQPLTGFVEHITRMVDVALDPFPHTGGTTTFQTLLMGVPIITMAGERQAGRFTLSILSTLGLEELVAANGDEYVEKAAALVADVDRLSAIREGLRGRMEASPFMDYRGFSATMEEAYRAMWHKWLGLSNRFEEGVAHHRAGHLAQAEALYRQTLAAEPDHAGATNNLAVLLKSSGRWEEAKATYERAVALSPTDSGVHYNYALYLESRGDLTGAAERYGVALGLAPDNASILNNMGTLMVRMGKPLAAIPFLERAVSADGREPNARLNLAVSLRGQFRLEEALAHLRACVEILPDGPTGWAELVTTASEVNDFALVEEARAQLDRLAKTPGALSAVADLPGLCNISYLRVLEGSTDASAEAAEAEILRRLGQPPRCSRPLTSDGPLRIGYLSKHFGNHAIGHVSRRLYQSHDRQRFSVHAYSLTDHAGESASFHQDIRGGTESFHEVQAWDAAAIAAKIAEDGIDLLVNLDGHMTAKGIEVMALRPAPIQVYWLGVAGTPGLPYHDYVIADPVVVRDGEQGRYPEAVVRLPDCYHSADPHEVAPDAPSRAAEGLPEDALVLCAFNNTQKIDRRIFDCWMELLREVPEAVLWLSHPRNSDLGMRNLQAAAEARGVAGNRLIFAKTENDKARHLRRHDLADLFLDTLSLTASTTALDVLWMGLPMVACPGETWPSRISASFLTCLGLEEFITPDLESYRRLALTLCRDPAARAAARQTFLAARLSAPLFDITRFTRHLEAAFDGMAARHRAGLSPDGFDVARV